MFRCRKKWTQYLSGNLSTEEEKQIEAHIDQCSVCDNKLSNELGSERAVFLNDGKQAKILKIAKWKNRIVNAVFVLSLALLITIISGLLSGLYYLWGEPSRAENAQRVSNIMTELTMPNISPGSGHTGTNVFFKMTGSYELQKQLGREEQSVGTLETNLFFNLMQVVRKWNGGSLELKMYFVHPEKQKEIVSEAHGWDTLEILPEGTVSELAVSFDKNYTLDEMYELFSGYDVELVWFPVDTGVEPDLRSTYASTIDGLWGFPNFGRALVYEPDSRSSGENWSNEGFSLRIAGDSDKKTAAFIEAMEFLAAHQSWAEKAYQGG